MSDNDENLISQDDIDQLLDASALENLDLSDGDGDGEMGELTQADIDNLLKDEPGGGDPLPPGEDLDDPLFGNDLDSLIPGDGSDAVAKEADMGDDGGGELSQDDIDALLNPVAEDGADQTDAPAPAGKDGPMPEDDSELISQDDIDELLMGSDAPQGDGEDDDDELISLEDVQGLLAEEGGPTAGPEPEVAPEEIPVADAGGLGSNGTAMEALPSEDSADAADSDGLEAPGQGEAPVDLSEADVDDGIILPEDAVSMEESLLTQGILDGLIQDREAEESALNPDPDQLLAELEAEGETDSLDELDLVALDQDHRGGDAPEEGQESEVTQEDIDALLMESSDGDEDIDDDEDILISQDDIDTLLMAADQEDEDVLGDLGGEIEDTGLGEDLAPDGLLDHGEEFSEAGEQIILEEGEDGSESTKGLGQWYRSRVFVAAVSIFLVLGISIPSAYFIFFSGGDEMDMDVPIVLPQEGPVPDDGLTGPVVQVNTAPPVQSQSGTLLLANFIVLAPDPSREMSFITTDVSIDYSDQRAYHEINKNMSYYRGLIYDAIQKNLTWEKRDEVTQPDLLWEIETTLKKVLPPQYIDSIRFKGFKTS